MREPKMNSILSANRYLRWHRFVSFVLAMLLLVSYIPLPALSVESEEHGSAAGNQNQQTSSGELIYNYDTLKVTLDGESINSLPLYEHEKIEIQADGLMEDATYQWQVQHPEKDDVWVNIFDGTNQSISVTAALVGNVLREDGTAKLRCRAYTEDYAYLSNSVTVTLMAEENAAAPTMYTMTGKNQGISLMAGDAKTPEFVTITVIYHQYKKTSNDSSDDTYVLEKENVFSSYVATLTHGAPRPNDIECPELVGYRPEIAVVKVGDVENSAAATLSGNLISITSATITSDIVITVHYKPIAVQYQVRYFFQNIYDDLYTEDVDKMKTLSGYTGTTPDLAQETVSGFTCLFFEPDSIAADGSTVFYVYYERNYYLMEFDCNGGYGTDTIYVRYGSYVVVPNPVKSGYVFAGWDFVSAKDENGDAVTVAGTSDAGTKDNLPASLPPYNSSYKALWTEADTTYTVAYWIVASNGDKTYIGSRTVNSKEVDGEQVPIKSGDRVDGEHDLASKANGGPAICGHEEHTHSDDCYTCGFEEHTHSKDDCFADMTLDGNKPGANGINAIKNYEGGGTPENGYIYVIANGTNLWPKLYIADDYWTINGIGSGTIPATQEQINTIVDGDPLGEPVTGSFDTETLTVTKYKAKTTCDTEQHTHIYSCRTCEAHTHDEIACFEDALDLVAVESYEYEDENGKTVEISTDKGVTVLGDGSTVVNVYYSYKTYIIRYVYARGVQNATSNDWEYAVSDSTLNGTLETVAWKSIGSTLPEFTDPDTNTTTAKYFERNGYRYYYVSVTAKFGEDISSEWPALNDVKVTYSGTTYIWGSWAAEVGTEYRDTIGQHANVVGSYPTMSAEMISSAPEALGNDTYVAQNMIAWWSTGTQISEHAYHNYFEVLSKDIPAGEISTDPKNPTEYNGHFYVKINISGKEKVYMLQNDMFVANHDGWTHVGAFEFTGFDWINQGIDLSDSTDFYNNGQCEICVDNCFYCNVFYYDRTPHSLKFYNFNGWLGSGSGAGNTGEGGGVSFGTPMSIFGNYVNAEGFMDNHYPHGLEPGAYKFAGWYTSPGCLDGTEVDWDTMTMPDADLTLYAKWEPIERDVYFYLTYDNMADYQDVLKNNPNASHIPFTWNEDSDGNRIDYPISLKHGEVLGTAYNKIPERTGYIDKNGDDEYTEGIDEEFDYIFVGWFYIDENGKKRFAPDTMEVKKDLHLFAEWRTEVDTEYTLYYKIQGQDTEVAVPLTGHMSVGHTKTFEAKAGTQLLPDYQGKALFPTTSSHSILMQPNPNDNTFTFEYVEEKEVLYQVKYIDKVTGVELGREDVKGTTNAIVTAKYKAFDGYIPENYYITRVLTADGNATKEPIPENIIVFYYIPTETTALYTVELFQEKVDSTDSSNLANYESVQVKVDSGTIGETINIPVSENQFVGFTYKFSKVTSYPDGTAVTSDPTTATTLSGTLSKTGLEFKIYYSRNSVGYTIQYLEWGTSKDLGTGRFSGDSADATHKVGSTKEFTAPAEVIDGNVTYYFYATDQKPQTQTLTFQANAANNVLTFYYKPKEVTIYYVPVCLTPGAKDQDFGRVSQNYENLTSSTVNGSIAMPSEGFKFVGWYDNPACSGDPIYTETGYTPSLPNENVTYYARFEPILSSLTIQNRVQWKTNGQEYTSSNYFLFHIQGQGKTGYIDIIVSIQGNNVVVLESLPVGDYTVTELTDWSWEYGETPHWVFAGDDQSPTDGTQVSIEVDTSPDTIIFTNDYSNVNIEDGSGTVTEYATDPGWLAGEIGCENVFSAVYVTN